MIKHKNYGKWLKYGKWNDKNNKKLKKKPHAHETNEKNIT
jgi:hypothetical protein